jgi:hypothetical protein
MRRSRQEGYTYIANSQDSLADREEASPNRKSDGTKFACPCTKSTNDVNKCCLRNVGLKLFCLHHYDECGLKFQSKDLPSAYRFLDVFDNRRILSITMAPATSIQASESSYPLIAEKCLPTTSSDSPELDAAVLAYLAKRGFSRSAKAFEKEAGAKASGQEDLEKAWGLLSAA